MDIPLVRVVHRINYLYSQSSKPLNGYAIEMKRKDNNWDLVLFCENKNNTISSSFLEALFEISNMGYQIKFE